MAESKENNSAERTAYRDVVKATSLFGGLKVYQIIISIIRSKFVAILLGPEGIGLSGLYSATIDLFKSGTSLGLDQSAVRDVAEANGTNDQNRINTTVNVVRRLVWLTGVGGMILFILASPVLSLTSFGNYSYTFAFIVLSVIILLDQLIAGNLVVLQGLRKYKFLSASSAIGITVGLVTTIPLYYFWGMDGIIPALIINAIVSYSLSWFFSRKVKIDKVDLTRKEVFKKGKGMMTLGIVMCMNSLLVYGASYVLKAYINNQASSAVLGLYQAGFAIVNTYAGMVFSAMSTDYYPRLASVCQDNKKSSELINRQIEMSLLILTPIVAVSIVFTPFFLSLLYSDSFIEAYEYVKVAMFGMLFRAVSWSIGHVFIAKGESKLFTTTSICFNVFFLIDDITWFYFMGIGGLGISFACNYLIHLITVYLIARHKYSFSFNTQFLKLFIPVMMISVALLGISYVGNTTIKYTAGGVMILVATAFSLYKMNEYIGLKEFIKSKIKK